jgi:class 3 adenylate cyclase
VSEPREIEIALLFADLAGYSALTEAHGNFEAATVVGRYLDMVRQILPPGAWLMERVGDELVIAAPESPLLVATALRLRAAVEAEPLFPAVRAGLHAGQVVETEGGYIGAALNIASRVTAHAQPGQILCTEPVVRQASAMPDVEFRPLGPLKLRHITQPVQVFEIVAPVLPKRTVIDPVCRMTVTPETAAVSVTLDSVAYHFCSEGCAERFRGDPTSYRER